MEDELRAYGTHPKHKDQIERKQELEINLELSIKSLANMRTKLKELSM